MSHFARVTSDGVVQEVIVAEQDFIDTMTAAGPGDWIKCSFNSKGGVHTDDEGHATGNEHLRYNYPGIGWNYDREADAFYPPNPGEGWTLNTETYLWEEDDPSTAE